MSSSTEPAPLQSQPPSQSHQPSEEENSRLPEDILKHLQELAAREGRPLEALLVEMMSLYQEQPKALDASPSESVSWTDNLLVTKLHIPNLHANLTARPRLVKRIQEGVDLGRRLTIVTAPAGFGKTTLLAEWAHTHPGAVVWLSLDERDNDTFVFWHYVITAHQSLHPKIGSQALGMLRSWQAQRSLEPAARETLSEKEQAWLQAALTSLLNQIAQLGQRVFLVLDDYHLIKNPAIHTTLRFFIDYLPLSPHSAHVAMTTRLEPPIKLSQLRAKGLLTELGTNELRFTPEEATGFLKHSLGIILPPGEIARLLECTEGWAAALQMAALSLDGIEALPHQLPALTSDQRHIMEYLSEEVFQRQPPEMQEFLLNTAILDRMTPPLCDAVTGVPGSDARLETLERANLFTSSLDLERRWYRYHPLFQNLLKDRLKQRPPQLLRDLHQRASLWYETQGQVLDAVKHSLAVGDIERLSGLLVGKALPPIDRNEAPLFDQWLSELPPGMLKAQPWLLLARAWVFSYIGGFKEIIAILDKIEEILDHVDEDPLQRHLAGHVDLLRSVCAFSTDDPAQIRVLAMRALDQLPVSDWEVRAAAHRIIGVTLRLEGHLDQAVQAFEHAANIANNGGVPSMTQMMCQVSLATTRRLQGHLQEAAVIFRTLLSEIDQIAQQEGRSLPPAGIIYLEIGRILWLQNDYSTALRVLPRGIDLLERWGTNHILCEGYLLHAQVLLTEGNIDSAHQELQKGRLLARSQFPWYQDWVESLAALIYLRQSHFHEVRHWVAQNAQAKLGFNRHAQVLALARCYLSLGKFDSSPDRFQQAQQILISYSDVVKSAGAVEYMIETLVLLALVHQALRQTEAAVVVLSQALSLAEPEGYRVYFTQEGSALCTLLRLAARNGTNLTLIGELLASMQSRPSGEMIHWPHEPLSERELEVLRLLAVGLPNKAIAETLVITPGTAKKHLQNIYAKLEVSSRLEAVNAAHKLNLV